MNDPYLTVRLRRLVVDRADILAQRIARTGTGMHATISRSDVIERALVLLDQHLFPGDPSNPSDVPAQTDMSLALDATPAVALVPPAERRSPRAVVLPGGCIDERSATPEFDHTPPPDDEDEPTPRGRGKR